ncbi:MAG: bifunctional pyr operon transcriptional regulator/uracil phosphoribosyltransferase PyrR [Myxococcota bacterium]|nr:bifunctional pyr operon transcriptional regulator/uracil phosphoribosyltransferase PyrR [Myxococcota bacterium]
MAHDPSNEPARASAPKVSPPGAVVLDDVGVRRALMRIAHEILERNDDARQLYLVAIPNGGVPLARTLIANLEDIAGETPPLGILDTTLYRDDLTTSGERPPLRQTEMPSSVDGSVVVLVEDVVNTGRTIRAAMDALMDFGRPRMVQLVALIDRGHRELPIKIDYIGKNIPTQPSDRVRLIAEESGEAPMLVMLEGLADDRGYSEGGTP